MDDGVGGPFGQAAIRPLGPRPRVRAAAAPGSTPDCAVVSAPTLDRALARWCFTVECDRPRRWAAAFSDPATRTASTTRTSRSVATAELRACRVSKSRQPPRRGQPLIPALDRDLVGCYRAPTTCRAPPERPRAVDPGPDVRRARRADVARRSRAIYSGIGGPMTSSP